MEAEKLVRKWFHQWENGSFEELPISENFSHMSPFGTIEGRQEYLNLVRKNRDKFLGYRFDIHEMLSDESRLCVRYTAIQGDFQLDVTEWHYIKGGAINHVHAYYHIGDVRDDRQLEE